MTELPNPSSLPPLWSYRAAVVTAAEAESSLPERLCQSEGRVQRAEEELGQLRAGLADAQARHQDTALLLERLSGQNASLRAQLKSSSPQGGYHMSEAPATTRARGESETLEDQFTQALRLAGVNARMEFETLQPQPHSDKSAHEVHLTDQHTNASCNIDQRHHNNHHQTNSHYLPPQPHRNHEPPLQLTLPHQQQQELLSSVLPEAAASSRTDGLPAAGSLGVSPWLAQPAGYQTRSLTPSSRSGCATNMATPRSTEVDALRHSIWQLERALEGEKRRSAEALRKLDRLHPVSTSEGSGEVELAALHSELAALRSEMATCKGLEAAEVSALQKELAASKRSEAAELAAFRSKLASSQSAEAEVTSLRSELSASRAAEKKLRLEGAARDASAASVVARTSSALLAEVQAHSDKALPSAKELSAQASLAGALRQELQQEREALHLLHGEEQRLATSEQQALRDIKELRQELASAEASSASWRQSSKAASLEEQELEAFSTLLRAEASQAEAAVSRAREDSQHWRQQLLNTQLREARSESSALEYVEDANHVRSELKSAEEQAAHLQRKLHEAAEENAELMREGRTLRQQLVDALREVSQGGDRLLQAWERCRVVEDELGHCKRELAEAREESAEVSAALVEEQSQASVLRCRLRESGLLPPLEIEGGLSDSESSKAPRLLLRRPSGQPVDALAQAPGSPPASSWQRPHGSGVYSPG
eukprot:TRINITY_DN12810_c0_g1_i2.p1 TRINITY_DN12810_c0_g1~~TRINITY_DN12810_c0_g1_i2.p1  ORF type:complete len:715 (-),score=195.62 TRINITY_DN12810_c0_g1_i2:7-2151(-)